MKEWISIMPPEEREVFRKAGFAAPQAVGQKPALVLVDVTLAFTGRESQTREEALQEFRTSCAPASWQTLPRIRQVLDWFREKGYPVVFTRGFTTQRFTGGATVSSRLKQTISTEGNEFPEIVKPLPGEVVLEKSRASAFFGTMFSVFLREQGIDTLVVGGVSTSGCVRATVVDGFSHSFTVFLLEDCCFDRSRFAHLANLFDMNAKYATVLNWEEMLPLVGDIPGSRG